MQKADWFAVALAGIVPGLGFIYGPRTGVPSLIGGLIALAVWFVWEDGPRQHFVMLKPADEWNELAGKFERIRQTVRAEWYSESLDWEAKPVGEQWMIRDDFDADAAKTCEALCHLAGAMLMKSPQISQRLSEKVRSRSNDAWRWLYFLTEKPGTAKTYAKGNGVVHGFRYEGEGRVIERLASESARRCIENAAAET